MLKEAARGNVMRQLMDAVLKDPTVGGYHDDIRRIWTGSLLQPSIQ
jgi:hypothetical protein